MGNTDTAPSGTAPPWSDLDAGAPRLAAWARSHRVPPWSGWVAFAAAYLGLTALGYLLLDPATHMAVWWPPIGLLLATLLVLPPRRWPVALAVAVPLAVGASLLRGRPTALAFELIAGNLAEALAGAWAIRLAAGSRPRVSTVRGALAVGTLPAIVGGVLTLGAGAVHALASGGELSSAPRVFWSGTSLGALVVAPLVLAWLEPPAPSPRVRAWEVPSLAGALALALFLFTSGGPGVWAEEVVLIPPLAWAAFRFGPRGATAAMAVATLVLAGFGAAGTLGDDRDPVQAAQFILAVLGATSLFVAAASEERRRATDDLARSRELLDSFFARAPLGMFVKDDRHRALVLSAEFLRLLGVPADALLGRTVAETLPAPLGAELLELERAALRAGAPLRREIAFGDRTFIDVAFPIPRARGDAYVGGLALDVTERVRAEAALRESEQRLRIVEAALDQASDAVGVVDEDGRYVWVNAARARMLGLTKDRLLGRTLFEVTPDVTPEVWRRRWEETAARGATVEEEAMRTADGRSVPCEIARAVVGFGGRRYLVASVRDVSDRRRAESAARLAGIGTLAAGVAHEINNPLSYVLSNVAWLREHCSSGGGPAPAPPPEEVRRVVEEVQDGAVRVRDIVQRLRLFARPDETVGPVDVAAAARAAIGIVQNDVRHRASLVSRFADVPPVLGNENRLAQAFLNLLTNAAQAIPAGHADRNAIVVEIRRGDGGEVVAEVSDTGGGIPDESRARLFEPFFTTRPVGAGTGLGLFVCHGIVAGMGGRIEVESELGSGSTFRVVLPPAAPGAPAPRPAPAEVPAPARRARVLVVDDDARVASALRRVLQRDHDVDVSTDPRAALARVRGGEAWDVVFCDLMMPEMSGMEWYEEVRRAAPALAEQVVFVTGGAFTDGAREFLERVPNARIEKPFAPDEIRALVARRVGAG